MNFNLNLLRKTVFICFIFCFTLNFAICQEWATPSGHTHNGPNNLNHFTSSIGGKGGTPVPLMGGHFHPELDFTVGLEFQIPIGVVEDYSYYDEASEKFQLQLPEVYIGYKIHYPGTFPASIDVGTAWTTINSLMPYDESKDAVFFASGNNKIINFESVEELEENVIYQEDAPAYLDFADVGKFMLSHPFNCPSNSDCRFLIELKLYKVEDNKYVLYDPSNIFYDSDSGAAGLYDVEDYLQDPGNMMRSWIMLTPEEAVMKIDGGKGFALDSYKDAVGEIALVYPNPVVENAVLEFKTQEELNLTGQLFDMNGSLVNTIFGQKHFAGGNHKVDILTTDLPAGAYFVKLFDNTRIYNTTLKMIKTHGY